MCETGAPAHLAERRRQEGLGPRADVEPGVVRRLPPGGLGLVLGDHGLALGAVPDEVLVCLAAHLVLGDAGDPGVEGGHVEPRPDLREAEVQQLNASMPKAEAGPAEGTLGFLIARYKDSPEWDGLKPATRVSYERAFAYLKALDMMPVDRISPPFVLQMRDRCFRTHKRWLANYVVTVLSTVWVWGRPRGYVKGANPCEAVDRIRKPKGAPEANCRWDDDELEVVLSRLEPLLALAVALGAYLGLREEDAVGWRWSAYRDGAILGRQAKTGGEVWGPAHPRLRDLLDAAPRTAETIMTGLRGRTMTVSGFRAMFFRRLRGLEREGLVRPGLTFHGLRHSLASALAEAGCTPQQIQAIIPPSGCPDPRPCGGSPASSSPTRWCVVSPGRSVSRLGGITGHETLAMVETYVAKANRRKLAREAMDRLVRKAQRK